MSWRPFAVVLMLPLIFTAATLIAAMRNRSAVVREIVLTDRDVSVDAGSDPTSGARVWVSWSDAPAGTPWASCAALTTVGFSCGVDPRSADAERYYARQLPRYAFVAFSVDGSRPSRSRLVPIDVAPNVGPLARRYPSATTIIMPAIVAIARFAPLAGPPYVTGVVTTIDPRGIQVPTELRHAIPARARQGVTPPMNITIRYGRRWEPWIAAIASR
jgi:hypothetical protein